MIACSKCGSTHFNVLYIKRVDLLTYTCSRCQHYWEEIPDDQKRMDELKKMAQETLEK